MHFLINWTATSVSRAERSIVGALSDVLIMLSCYEFY